MFDFIRSLLQRRQEILRLYRVDYTHGTSHFYQADHVIARTSYEAARQFDTNPHFSNCRRRGNPTPVA